MEENNFHSWWKLQSLETMSDSHWGKMFGKRWPKFNYQASVLMAEEKLNELSI